MKKLRTIAKDVIMTKQEKIEVAKNTNTSSHVLEELEYWTIRYNVAENPSTPLDIKGMLLLQEM